MKSPRLAQLLLIAFLCLGTSYTNAHVIETDNTVSALLHIDPDDDPVTNEEASLHLHFKKSDSSLFSVTKCECVFSITPHNTQTNSHTFTKAELVIENEQNITLHYTFPTKGIYSLIVHSPSFTLKYDTRVDRESDKSWIEHAGYVIYHSIHHTLHYIILGGGIVAVIMVVIRDKRRESAIIQK